MRRLAVLAALILPTTALAGPFDGLYRPNYDFAASWDCETIGMEGGALAVEDNTLYGIDNACKLNGPIDVRGMSAVLYEADCGGEGTETAERVMLMSHEYGLYVIRDGLVLDWLRCE